MCIPSSSIWPSRRLWKVRRSVVYSLLSVCCEESARDQDAHDVYPQQGGGARWVQAIKWLPSERIGPFFGPLLF
jgi:hypothetical protein